MLTLIIVKFLSSLSCSLAYSGFLKGIFRLADTLHYSSCYPMSCTLICCSCYVCRQLFHCFFFTKHVKFSPFFLRSTKTVEHTSPSPQRFPITVLFLP